MRIEDIGSSLEPWDVVKDLHEWSGLLLGNGASQAVWSKFSYSSLYEVAKQQAVHPLSASDEALFDAFGTTNFELVLSSLATAGIVNQQLGVPAPVVTDRYRSIQQALVQAVCDAHLPWDQYLDSSMGLIKAALRDFRFVYSTNYDLLLYWAINHGGASGFKDYFWPSIFNLANADERGEATYVLYMHGGIHLYRTPGGETVKYKANEGSNLLGSFGSDVGRVPLFVAEGDAKSKISAIRRSDYLTFAYSKLLNHDGPMVIFGCSLGPSDKHIADAISKAKCDVLAIAIYPGTSTENKQAKAEFVRLMPRKELVFFDSTTHPLGGSGLRVQPEVGM